MAPEQLMDKAIQLVVEAVSQPDHASANQLYLESNQSYLTAKVKTTT